MRDNQTDRKPKINDGYKHILKYTGIFGSVQGLNVLISLVRNKLVAVILGADGMGLASLFNTTVGLVSQITNLGISFSAVRHISETFESGDIAKIEHTVKVVRSWALLTALLGMLTCAVFGSFLNDFTFSWGDHSLHFIVLGIAVGLAAVTGGETAILKGTRRLRKLALIQVYTVLVSLVISVPIYLMFHMSGIVPVIVLVAFASMILTVVYSYRFYPLRLQGLISALGEGKHLVQLGVAFSVAGIMTNGAEFIIRSFLNKYDSLYAVGLYNAGYMMTMVYGGMVFSAMETDFFPRLSAVNNDQNRCNSMINRQIEVSLLIISPLLVLFSMGLPLIVTILFSSEFTPVVGMVQITVLALYLRVMKLPVAYLTLAKGDSLCFFLLEAYSAALMVTAVSFGWKMFGLEGAGLGLLVTELIDLIVINIFTRCRYGYRSTNVILVYAAQQLPIAVVMYVCVTTLTGSAYWLCGCALVAVSLAFSLHYLRKKH